MKLYVLIFIFFVFAVVSTSAFGEPVVSASGEFDSSAVATTLSAPDAIWSLSFTVNSPE